MQLTRFTGRFIVVCSLALTTFASAAPAAPDAPPAGGHSLVYRTPAGVTFEVSDAGLSSIRYRDRDVAGGGWSMFDASGWFKEFRDPGESAGSGEARGATVKVPAKFAEQSVEVIDARHARVRQGGGEVVCTADYAFDGEDVTIAARVENNNPEVPLRAVGFSGLVFHFDALPHGMMPVQHSSYFQANGLRLCHPGEWQRIGGTWAADESVGVGTSPWNTGIARTLTLWDYESWQPAQREKSPHRKLVYIVPSTVPPRGAATFEFMLRVSPERDWKHLLGPYREHFQRTFGPVRYKADDRWIATDYLNHSVGAINKDNPYGFQVGHRRIDTAAGAAAFCDTVIRGPTQGNGQGAIVWGQGGEEPRGGMYRPDFDVLPPEVEANWGTIASRFKEADLKLGVATRPRHMAVRADWKHDEIIDINPDDPGHQEMLWRRFENMINKGCTLFYLDSFGDSFDDVKLMRFLRGKLGENVLTFAEHQCDAIFPYSGGYSETTFEPGDVDGAGKTGQPPHYRLWSGLTEWEVYQWLAPGCQMAARLYEVKGKIPEDFESPDHFFLSRHITPLVPVNDFARAAGLKELQKKMTW